MDDWGYDKKLIRRYKAWLKQYNDLWDWAAAQGDDEQWSRFSDSDIEEMRNRRQPHVTRYGYRDKEYLRYNREPTYDCFFSHFSREFPYTLYLTNAAFGKGTILMCADVDNKTGQGDVDRAVLHTVATYGFGSYYAEPSTHWRGRHLNFLLDIGMDGADDFLGNRSDIWTTFAKFAEMIKADPMWQETGCSFDGFFGRPTLWKKSKYEQVRIVQRGDALKAPRVHTHAQMDELEALRPISLQRLQDALRGRSRPTLVVAPCRVGSTSTLSQGVLCSANGSRYETTADMKGDEKKKRCISEVLRRTDGECEVEDVYEEYMARWSPNPDKCPKKRIGQIAGYFKGMKRRYRKSLDGRKHPFKSGEFLAIVKATVPAEEFAWEGHNRATISPEKLADFIGLKIADSFYPKGWETGWFAQTSRDRTIENSRMMKAGGLMNWTVTTNTYKVLLDLSERYELLHVYEPHKKPIVDPRTRKVLVKGKARMIGPGAAEAMKALKDEWLPLYHAYQRRLWAMGEAAATAA